MLLRVVACLFAEGVGSEAGVSESSHRIEW